MGRRKLDEFAPENIDEIENGVVQSKCRTCGSKQKIFVRMHTLLGFGPAGMQERETGVRTQNMIGGCTNTECFRYIDPNTIQHWVLAESPTGRPPR